MAVDNSSLWWSAWGVWFGVWLVTLLAVVVAGWLLVKNWRGERRAPHRQRLGLSIYLHTTSVMNLWQLAHYDDPLQEDVTQVDTQDRNLGLGVVAGGVKGNAAKTTKVEKFRQYIATKGPITVIGPIMDVLEARDDIIHVDLTTMSITRNKALADALGWTDGPATGREQTARLDGIDVYVSFTGSFRKASQTAERTVFLARYGQPGGTSYGSRVRFTCETADMQQEIPAESKFQGRCLGRVDDWDAETGELLVHPIAIFK